MTPEQIVVLAMACLVFMGSPGPGVFAVVSRSLAFGYRRNLGFIGGMVLGDLVLLGLAVSGLATIAAAFGDAFRVLTLIAAAYLVYLGVNTWIVSGRGDGEPTVAAPSDLRGFVSGFTITLSNPKTILFYMAFLPAFVDLGHLSVTGMAIVAVVVGLVLSVVMLSYSFASSAARDLFRSRRAVLILNRGAACLMVAAGIVLAVR